jgi:cephalosporin hydroxylase
MSRRSAAVSRTRRRLTRVARAAEQPVLVAFAQLIKRQRGRGGLTPAVETTLAEMLTIAMAEPGTDSPSSRALADAVRAASASLYPASGAGQPTLTKSEEGYLARLLPHLEVAVEHRPRAGNPAVRAVVDAFHRLWYEDRGTWRTTQWQGITTWKCPLDLWLYQEIIHKVRPGLIVETGTAYGGSALYLSWLCDLEDRGRIVSVDIEPKTESLPTHPRLTFLRGSSTDAQIVDQVREMIPPGEPVMVILDSDHSEEHVRNELMAYADLVTPGSYLIVEDTNINGHPALPTFGPGPMEALEWFLTTRSDFAIDRSKDRFYLTLNPRGFLKKKRPL